MKAARAVPVIVLCLMGLFAFAAIVPKPAAKAPPKTVDYPLHYVPDPRKVDSATRADAEESLRRAVLVGAQHDGTILQHAFDERGVLIVEVGPPFRDDTFIEKLAVAQSLASEPSRPASEIVFIDSQTQKQVARYVGGQLSVD